MANYNKARIQFSGVPNHGDSFSYGPDGSPTTFQFVINQPITTPEQIEVGDLTSGSQVAARSAEVVSASDLNLGWSAVASGNKLDLTPAGGDPGSCGVTESVTNATLTLRELNPNGVIHEG